MYRSQYENEYGELWVFVYDDSTNTGILTGSDMDWQDYPVVDGKVIGLLFNDGELVWLRSAWESAIKGPRNPDRNNGGSASEQHDSRSLH